MRPGKPLALENIMAFHSSGCQESVSAFVSFEVFVRPALEQLSGQTPHPHPSQKARLAEPVESDGRESYLRAIVTERRVNSPSVLRSSGIGKHLFFSPGKCFTDCTLWVKSLPANTEAEICASNKTTHP